MSETFESWAVLELMGHVRTAGRITEEQRFGATLGRCDVPQADGSFVTIYFGGSSVYRLTPCSEEAARAVALRNKPEPVHAWELPQPKLEAPRSSRDAAGNFDPDEDRYDIEPDLEDDEEALEIYDR